MNKKNFLFLLSGLFVFSAFSTTGFASPDCALYTTKSGYAFRSDGAAFQADGKVVVIGEFKKGIIRLNKNGTIDHQFNTGGAGFNDVTDLSAILITPDQRIWVGGRFQSYNGVAIRNLARLNPDGSLDSTFDPLVYGMNPAWKDSAGAFVNPISYEVSALQFSPDAGQIWIRSYMYEYMNTALFPVRLDGSLDPSSGINSQKRDPYNWLPGVADVRNFTATKDRIFSGFDELDLDGKLIRKVKPETLGGSDIQKIFHLSDGRFLVLLSAGGSDGRLVRLSADGKLDSTFTAVRLEKVSHLDVTELPSGRYLLDGSFHDGVVFENPLVVNANGDLAFDFMSKLGEDSYAPHAYFDLPSQTYFVIGGDAHSSCAYTERTNANGNLDRRIDLGDSYYYGGAILSQLSNGNILANAKFMSDGIYTWPDSASKRVDKLLELDQKTGKVVRSVGDAAAWFAPMNYHNSATGILQGADDRALIWGGFNFYNGEANHGLIRLDLKTGLQDSTFTSALDLHSSASSFRVSKLPNGGYFVSGGFQLVGVTPEKSYDYAYLQADGSLDPLHPPVALRDNSPLHEALYSRVTDHIVRTDGSILLAGSFFLNVNDFASPSEFGVLLTNGQFDRTGFIYSRYERDFAPARARFWEGHLLTLGATYDGAHGSLKLLGEKTGNNLSSFLIPAPFSGSHVNNQEIQSFELLSGDRLLLGYGTRVKDLSDTKPGSETLPGPFIVVDSGGAVQHVVTLSELGIPTDARPEVCNTRAPNMLKLRDGSILSSFSFESATAPEHGGWLDKMVTMVKFTADGNADLQFRPAGEVVP